MSKCFCIGDIHGSYLALRQVLQRSKFDYKNDLLITIGDIVDGWGDSFMVVEELLKINNRIDIRGNHDDWFNIFIENGIHPVRWGQGGLATAKSYAKELGIKLKIENNSNYLVGESYMINLNSGDIPETHKRFFRRQASHYFDDDNNLFVHGGFNRHSSLIETSSDEMMWDRKLFSQAMSVKGDDKLKFVQKFNQIFIGHTATTHWGTDKPIKADIIWNLDSGAGSDGKLTIMDIDTNEYWQSDLILDLYPNDEHALKFK